jgi:hypothetical protein
MPKTRTLQKFPVQIAEFSVGISVLGASKALRESGIILWYFV